MLRDQILRYIYCGMFRNFAFPIECHGYCDLIMNDYFEDTRGVFTDIIGGSEEIFVKRSASVQRNIFKQFLNKLRN